MDDKIHQPVLKLFSVWGLYVAATWVEILQILSLTLASIYSACLIYEFVRKKFRSFRTPEKETIL